MSYQEQIFKDLARGKYGKKPYVEISRHKTNINRNNDKKDISNQTDVIFEDLLDLATKNKYETIIRTKKINKDVKADEINNNISNTLSQIPNSNDEDIIKNEIKLENFDQELSNRENEIEKLMVKFMEVEQCLIVMSKEFDKMKILHTDIYDAIQKLSTR